MRDDLTLQLYAEVLHDFRRHIIAFCYRHSESRLEAEQLSEEVVDAVRRSIGGLDPASTLQQRNRWLQKVMRHAYSDHRQRRRVRTVPLDEAAGMAVGEDYDRELLEALLQHLSAAERDFLQEMFDGYTPAEMARRRDTSRNAIYQYYHRIVKKLRDAYKQHYAD